MKLLSMPARTAQPGLLPQVWATDGNLARTVLLQQNSAASTTAAIPALRGKAPAGRLLSPEAAFYRSYTEGLLRRYGMMQLARARVPAMLGGASTMFRGRASTYKVRSFDDVIIFVHDVDNCLKLLSAAQCTVLKRVGVQGYSFEEAAVLLSVSSRSVRRHYAAALDALTLIFLDRGLLERDRDVEAACAEENVPARRTPRKPPQRESGCATLN